VQPKERARLGKADAMCVPWSDEDVKCDLPQTARLQLVSTNVTAARRTDNSQDLGRSILSAHSLCSDSSFSEEQ
jgi:hypothetical protein